MSQLIGTLSKALTTLLYGVRKWHRPLWQEDTYNTGVPRGLAISSLPGRVVEVVGPLTLNVLEP